MHGLAVSKDGKRVFVTGSTKYLLEARCNGRGDWNWQPPIALATGNVHLTGIALEPTMANRLSFAPRLRTA